MTRHFPRLQKKDMRVDSLLAMGQQQRQLPDASPGTGTLRMHEHDQSRSCSIKRHLARLRPVRGGRPRRPGGIRVGKHQEHPGDNSSEPCQTKNDPWRARFLRRPRCIDGVRKNSYSVKPQRLEGASPESFIDIFWRKLKHLPPHSDPMKFASSTWRNHRPNCRNTPARSKERFGPSLTFTAGLAHCLL